MLFAFFIVSALDLLGLMDDDDDPATDKGKEKGKKITAEEKAGWTEWVYYCQHPKGGFRGFTGAIIGAGKGEGKGRSNEWDAANLPATFFALCILLILGDNLTGVKRGKCLSWVRRLQREDGSFGEVLSSEGRIEGGRDLRFCCCAAGIGYILGKEGGEVGFNEEGMVRYIKRCQSYEGGFSEGPWREAHSGLTYCAVGGLAFLGMLREARDGSEGLTERYKGVVDLEACVKWMLGRQTEYIEHQEEEEEFDDGEGLHTRPLLPPPTEKSSAIAPFPHVGFNGRTNKIADTCYAFWNVGALAILGKAGLIDKQRLRRYLLEKVQHPIGGFGKGVGEPPDVLHSYLGLAVLGLLGEEGVKGVEPMLCVSEGVAGRVAGLRWKRDGGREG